jgi:glyceraldehyde 3-phosphate dehydrogenase
MTDDRIELTTEEIMLIRQGAERLRHQFEGTFNAASIERYMLDSQELLQSKAKFTKWLPLLIERLTRDRLRALSRLEHGTDGKPAVLFLCVHNAGRSQMGAGWLRHLAGDRVDVFSGGTDPGLELNDAAVFAMSEVGCGDACPRDLPGQALRGLGSARPLGATDRDRARDPRRCPHSRRSADRVARSRCHRRGWSAMSTRIGINGFGRIGRLVVRALRDRPDLELVHINEPFADVTTAAHLLEFDTVHGRYAGDVAVDDGQLEIDGAAVGFTSIESPGDVPWHAADIDIVLECSGKFRTAELLAPYFDRGVRTVIVAAPVKDDGVLNIVMGCNDHLYDPAVHHVVTAASCTTNCLAPVVKVLHEQIGIERGVITTIHDATNTQVVVDAPHKDLRRARSALNSLIPTSTGSATAITMIYPELAGKLNGVAVRVPLLNASLTDAVFSMSRDVTVEEVNGFLRDAADGELKGILGFEDRPLVSADYTNDTRSGIVDGPSTMVVDDRMVKVLIWYDNEYGYAFRMADLAGLAAIIGGADAGRIASRT